jgi:hypothetical protein
MLKRKRLLKPARQNPKRATRVFVSKNLSFVLQKDVPPVLTPEDERAMDARMEYFRMHDD